MKKFFKIIFWSTLSIVFLIFFTVTKIPDSRVRDYVQGILNQQLAPMGALITMREGRLGLFPTPHYLMKGVSVQSSSLSQPILADEISFTPSLLGFLSKKVGGSATVKQGLGRIVMDFWTQGEKWGLKFEAEKINLAQIGVIEALTGIAFAGRLEGRGNLQGNAVNFSPLEGDLKLELKELTNEESIIQGFKIPTLVLSESKFQVTFAKGKGTIQAFQLGKPGSADDLIAGIKGDMTLGRRIFNTELNWTVDLTLSDKIKKSFPPLDLLLGNVKKADGTYAFRFAGNVAGSIFPTPLQ